MTMIRIAQRATTRSNINLRTAATTKSSSLRRKIPHRSFYPATFSTLSTTANAPLTTTLAPSSHEHKATFSSAATITADTPSLETPTPPSRKYTYFDDPIITPSGIAIIKFNNPFKSVNTISFALKDEAKQLWLTEIAPNDSVKAVVFSSSKKDNFIAGADINDISTLEDKSHLSNVISDGMSFFASMKSRNIPLVAAINGSALGGGLEWALWCDYRIATENPKTKLGLPEVKLGLLPGFGGTQNLHAVVGLQAAMDMMLTGKEVRWDKAKKMGLVDMVVSSVDSLDDVAVSVAERLADGSLKASKKSKSWMNWLIEDTPFGRNMMWKKVTEMVDKNTNKKYPAPYAIIDCVKNGLDDPSSKYDFERESFVKLAQTKESEALIGIFEGMTAMKKHDLGDDISRPVSTVAVMGAGLMGAGIAQVTAEKNVRVLLKDQNAQSLYKGESYIHGNWDKKVKRKRMTPYQKNVNDANIIPLSDNTPNWQKHFLNANVIIEAVFEDLTLKKNIVKMVEDLTPNDTIFATNTSAIPIAKIAEGAQRPENIIGMHYFSPVPMMPLLEIIPHDGTSDATKATAFELGTKQGKTCVFVKDVPGFYVNRCLGPYLVEVSALMTDGIDLKELDASMVDFGMPVGPITLADEVGIDVAGHVAKFLKEADLGVRMDGGDVTIMMEMVEKGWLGKKSQMGFYDYSSKDGKKVLRPEVVSFIKSKTKQSLKLSREEIQNRMVSRLVNEAAKCLEDDIIADPVVGDIGMVFGTGFAPFRGGPFRYLDAVGVGQYVDMMMKLRDEYGGQFEPCQLLKDYAARGGKFHR